MATDFKQLVEAKDFDTLMEDARRQMAGGKITNWNVGGVFRTLAALCMQGLSELYTLIAEKILPNSYAATATGDWLDLICRDVDLERHRANKCEGFVTMGREGADGSVRIEAGSIVKTQTTASGDELCYFVTEEVILEDGQSAVQVPVTAEFAGARYNVGQGAIEVLVTHIYGIDYIGNDADWIVSEGSDDEDDETLRERYFLRWHELSTGSTALAYKSWALRTDGVLDAAVNDMHPRGQGTVDVIITSYDGEPSQQLIDEVTAYIETKRPQCSAVLVKAPRLTPIDIDAEQWLPTNEGDEVQTEAAAREVINAMFAPDERHANITPQKIGSPFYRARLSRWLMDLEHVFNVVINAPAEDGGLEYDQLAARNNITVSIRRVERS